MLSELSSKSTSQLGNLNGLVSCNPLGDNSKTSRPLGNGSDPRLSNGIWSNSVPSSNQSSKPQTPFSFVANQEAPDGTLPMSSQLSNQKHPSYESRWASWSTEYPAEQSNGSSLLQSQPSRLYDGLSRHVTMEQTVQSNQQNGISRVGPSLAPGSHRQVDKLTNGKNFCLIGNGLKLWDDSPRDFQPLSFQGKGLNFSTAGAQRHGSLPLGYGNDSSFSTESDPFGRFSTKPSPVMEKMPARPMANRHHSDHELALGISRLSMMDDDTSSLTSRRPSGFGLNLPSPGNSLFTSENLTDDSTIGMNGSYTQSSADAPSVITRAREKVFGLKLNNPNVAPFFPSQSTPSTTETPNSRHGSWQSDQASLYDKGQGQMQPVSSSNEPILHSQMEAFPQYRFTYQQNPQFSTTPQMLQQLHMNSLQQMQFNSWQMQQMQYPMSPFPNIFMNGMPQMSMPFPVSKPDLPTTASPISRPVGQDWMSQKIKDFRSSCKSKKWEIHELTGHIVELSGDQQGSRYLQGFLATASTQEKAKIFDEVYPNALPLMQDVFGNYVIQKFFEFGDQTQKKLLGSLMTGHVCNMSLNTYGCRVVQKAFEHVLADQQAALVSELNKPGMVLRCIEDQHGNHVIQKAIEVVPTHIIRFIYDELMGRILTLSEHNFGCRIVQRMLEQKNQTIRQLVLAELRPGGEKLITSTYGNYVAQHIISHGDATHREWMKGLVFTNIRGYGQDKFASNVVEVCIKEGSDAERRFIRDKIAEEEDGKPLGETGLAQFLKCNYGNYVVQKFIEYLTGEDRTLFIIQLENVINTHRRSIPKRVLDEIETKLNRSNSRRQNSKTKDVRQHSRHVSRTSGNNFTMPLGDARRASLEDTVNSTGKLLTAKLENPTTLTPPSSDESIGAPRNEHTIVGVVPINP